ncbi:MAG: hypothetical protein VW879_03430 [Opitutae bacterium]
MIQRITGAMLVAGILLLTCANACLRGAKQVDFAHHGNGHMEEK